MERGQRYAKLLGLGLSAGAVIVFIHVFAKFLEESDIRGLAVHHWRALLIATLVYCLAYLPMTIAWIKLAKASGAQASQMTLARVLLISQIGKYLPGNFAQFLGRAYLARASGVPLASSGLAIALELAGTLAASGILAATAVALGMASPQPGIAQAAAWISGFAGVAALLASGWIWRSKRGKANALVRPVIWAIGLYVLALTLFAMANMVLVAGIGGEWSWGIAGKVAGAVIVSWLIGFVTPGSPAGLGLRELTFFALLAGSIAEPTLLLTAIAFRAATLVGDLVAWLTGLLLPREDIPDFGVRDVETRP